MLRLNVTDNPVICKRCGTATQVVVQELDHVCGSCLTRADIATWLKSVTATDVVADHLPDDADELRAKLRSASSRAVVDDLVVARAAAVSLNCGDWFDKNRHLVEADHELIRTLERCASGSLASVVQAGNRIAAYRIIENCEMAAFAASLGSPADDVESTLFKLLWHSAVAVRTDAAAKILARRRLELKID